MDDVIRIGENSPDGWELAKREGLFDDDERPNKKNRKEAPPVIVGPLYIGRPNWWVDAPVITVPNGHNDKYHDKYHVYREQATPRWLSYDDREQMRSLYRQVAGTQGRLSVDHIVPLRGSSVCGLHVPWNLRLVPLQENRRKNNKHDE